MPTKDEIANFSMSIEELVWEKDVTYMDAIILHCEDIELEIELAAKLISSSLKAKIYGEAEDLNFLSTSNAVKLPI